MPRELPPGPAGFVGRTAEMEELSKALDQERQRDAFLAVIHGPPGVGKSALAITFAHSVRSRFRGGQLFAQMRGEGGGTAAVNSLIQHFVQSLRDPQDPFPGDAAEFREQYRYLTDGPYLTDGSGVLFVLDDVSPDLDIAALRPANPACALVVTCRERPSWLDVSYERELKPLPEQDALDLLRTTVGPDRVNSQEKLSLDLAVQCRGEPQALRAAGTALANRPNWDIGLLLRIANAALARLATQRSRPESFDAAYTLLTVDEQEALRALGVLGARSFAPWMLATALGTNEARGSRLASRLADAGLIDRYNSGSGAPTYVVEESVRNYAYDCAVTEGEAAETERRLDRLKEGPPLEAIGSIDELLQAHGGFTPAIDAVRNAISQARERDNRAREAAACAALADLYVDLGDMISADDLARLALSKGDSHSRARASRCLARIERRRHDFQAAIGHADRGLAQAAEAKDVPERIRVLEEKAVAVAAQGAAGETEAEKISAEVLRLCRSLGETGDPLLPGAMWARGNVLFHAHRYDEASGVLTAAKERAEALDQPRYSAWIDYLHARAALAAGDRAAAERYATQGLAAFAALRNRYGTAHCRYQLGQIHLASGHLDDAARSLREALESFRNCGDSWSESEISLGLARVYRRSAQIREAVQLQWDARRGYKQLGRRGEARKAMRELAGTVLTALRPRAVAVWMKVGFRRVLRPAGGRAGHLLAAILVAAAVGFAVYASLVPSTLLSAFGWVASLLLLAAGVAVQAGYRLRSRPRFGVPTYLPRKANLPFFCGREAELDILLRYHADHRPGPSRRIASSGPLVIGIHGRPGVGKTGLAQQLALRLARFYPDGQLYQNMGTGGGPRPPRDILHSLLRELQWPEGELRGKSAEQLASIFRAKTAGRRMLILLDAARSAEQLAAVLPGDSKCTVITTTRANLLAGSGQYSVRLGPVTTEEAATIFLTSLGETSAARPDLVAEAIELCDRQPNALLAAAERAGDEGLEETVSQLRRTEDRLDVLRYGGRDVAERIASVYANLEAKEREAFLLLTIPGSETFAPWALQPLMKIGSTEAGNLLASISRVGLLELEGFDPAGFGRYRFSSLIRAFAIKQLGSDDLPVEKLTEARDNFRRAYLASAIKVLGRLGVTGLPPLPFEVPEEWYPQVPNWDVRVARNLDFWVNAEFGSLISVVREAERYGQLTACWEIAARLGDCFSPLSDHAEIWAAFDTAVQAARRSNSPAGELRVRLAKCGYLTVVHDYSAAIDELTDTLSLAKSVRDRGAEAEALRRLGQAWQEIGYYDRALGPLREGRMIAIGNRLRRGTRRRQPFLELDDAMLRETRLTRLLLGENEAICTPSRWVYRSSAGDQHADAKDDSGILERIIAVRTARRRRDMSGSDLLREISRARGNLASRYAMEYETVATLLHWPAPAPDAPADPAMRSTVWLAAEALRSADRLGRPHAQVQARCNLAEALLHFGQVDECLNQLATARRVSQALTDEESWRLTVESQRIRGAALLRSGRPHEALAALESARQSLDQSEPWAQAEILVLIGLAHRMLGNLPAALSAHTSAAETFTQHRDYIALDQAVVELSVTLRLMAGQFSARRVERAFVGNITQPHEDQAAAMPGIEVEEHLGQATLETTVGVTANLEVRARPMAKHHFEPLAVRVLVTCEEAEVKPATSVGKITKDGLDSPLIFSLTPLSVGSLRIQTFIYDDYSGFLLKEVTTALPVIEPGTPRMTP